MTTMMTMKWMMMKMMTSRQREEKTPKKVFVLFSLSATSKKACTRLDEFFYN